MYAMSDIYERGIKVYGFSGKPLEWASV